MACTFQIGDFARSLETGWLGKIIAWEAGPNGDQLAKMMGVDWLAQTVAGLSADEALSSDDIQWFDVADLIPA